MKKKLRRAALIVLLVYVLCGIGATHLVYSSQFHRVSSQTCSAWPLYADTAHGRRPGFSNAARPEQANPLYERVVAKLRERLGAKRVGTGRFGADMAVELVNDGPVSVEVLAGVR